MIDANPAALAAGVATGVVFQTIDGLGLGQALRRLVTLFEDRPTWTRLQRNGINAPLDWQQSSRAYADLYESLFA